MLQGFVNSLKKWFLLMTSCQVVLNYNIKLILGPVTLDNQIKKKTYQPEVRQTLLFNNHFLYFLRSFVLC